MLIGSNVIKSSVARYRSIDIANVNVPAGNRVSVGTLNLGTAEHGVTYYIGIHSTTIANCTKVFLEINGAAVNPLGWMIPRFPGTTDGRIEPLYGIYIPPNSVLEGFV